MKYRLFTILTVLLFLGASCIRLEDLAKQRAEQAEQAQGDILVGAVAPWSAIDVMLWEGMAMAMDEINDAGGVLGRKIKMMKRDDEASAEKGVLIAQEFGENPDLVAVVGHYQSIVTVPASVVYQYYGILLLSAVDTDPDLTRQGFSLIFRTAPNDEDYGKKLMEYFQEKGYRRLVFYVGRNEYGRDFTDAFATAVQREGLQILDGESYDDLSSVGEFRKVLRRWKELYSFDALVLSGKLPQAGIIIREARRLGLEKPIIGGIALDRNELLTMFGKEVKDVFLLSNFDPYSKKPEVRNFVKAFQKRHGKTPDVLAAQGYDTVYTLAYAIRHAKSTSPPKMADALRAAKNLKGVTGVMRFSQDGVRIVDNIFIKMVENGQFKRLNAETN